MYLYFVSTFPTSKRPGLFVQPNFVHSEGGGVATHISKNRDGVGRKTVNGTVTLNIDITTNPVHSKSSPSNTSEHKRVRL